MKIYVKGAIHLNKNDIYLMTIKLIEGDKILVSDKWLNEKDNNLFFIVKSLTLGTYNFDTDTFDIVIEKPSSPIEKYIDKKFVKL